MGVYEPEFTGADGYELVERFADGKNGLNAALFANGNDRVLVFAGTDPGSWANWKANFAQAFGFKSATKSGEVQSVASTAASAELHHPSRLRAARLLPYD